MMRYALFAIGCFVALTEQASALPPPDLVISVSQSILSALGMLAAMCVLALSSIRIYFQQMFANRLLKWMFYIALAGVVLLVIFLAILYYNLQTERAFKASIEAELIEIWSTYEGVYDAEDEWLANATLTELDNAVGWDEFLSLADGGDYLILDIRDRVPFEQGTITGSQHSRFTDLVLGDWRKYESFKDTPILLVCYQGTTGVLASTFLESQGFSKVYRPEDGILHNRDFPIDGAIRIPRNDKRVDELFTKDVIDFKDEEDLYVIDLRSSSTADVGLPITEHYFRDRFTSEEIELYVSELPKDRTYAFVCNSEVSCYGAGIFYYDFERYDLPVSGILEAFPSS